MARAVLDTGTAGLPYDGALRCLLCRDASPGAEHGWCPAARGMVCDSCCRRLVSGDPGKLLGNLPEDQQAIALLDMIASCADCPRLLERIAERTLAEEHPGSPAN